MLCCAWSGYRFGDLWPCSTPEVTAILGQATAAAAEAAAVAAKAAAEEEKQAALIKAAQERATSMPRPDTSKVRSSDPACSDANCVALHSSRAPLT